ncbi:hypothetical protein [uncultured Muribaculum sp.]|nr:hypothetical protein [uncultured Muribaculum sp.]
MPFQARAFCCDSDSIEKIEIVSTYGIFYPVGFTRFSWINDISRDDHSWRRAVITSPKKLEEIMTILCQANKIEDLDYDVYDPAVKIVSDKKLGLIWSKPITPWVDGTMVIYVKGRKIPELIWLYIRRFDRGKARYELPAYFFELLHSDD